METKELIKEIETVIKLVKSFPNGGVYHPIVDYIEKNTQADTDVVILKEYLKMLKELEMYLIELD